VKLAVFASAWALGGLAACLREVERGDFDGVEGPPPPEPARARELGRELSSAGVPYIAEVCTGGDYAPASAVPFSRHVEDFRLQAELAALTGARLVTCLGGSD